jgi:glutamate carboxypeptidase
MAKRQEDLDKGVEAMLALTTVDDDGIGFAVTRGVTRPVWEPSAGTHRLIALAEGLHKEAGMAFRHQSAGGGSDGNFTGAMGIPTLDGLGVEGAMLHTLREHIRVDTLVKRGRVMAGLLANIE